MMLTATDIKKLRQDLNLTQSQLAEKLGLCADSVVVSRWERGVSAPNTLHYVRLVLLKEQYEKIREGRRGKTEATALTLTCNFCGLTGPDQEMVWQDRPSLWPGRPLDYVPGCKDIPACMDRIQWVCPECRETRPGDARVRAGKKCAACAGYGTVN